MKRLVCLVCGCWWLVSACAQTTSLAIATDKTVSLVFPYPVLHVDRGTKDVLVQQVNLADNILLVKAARPNFKETNLSVVTKDGSVYTFRVLYSGNPRLWVMHVPPQKQESIASYANDVADNPPTMHGIRDHSWDMMAKVIGIYIQDKVMYYQLQFTNIGPIDYDIDLMKFYIRDQKKGKRTAVQENEVMPLYISDNVKVVKAKSTKVVVVALDQFTIPDRKYLGIQIMEKNGGRHLLLRVHNNKIIKAIPLPELK